MARSIDTTKLLEKINNMGFSAFHHEGEDDIVKVSAEKGDDAADYNGVGRGGFAWINPKLESLADKMDCYWEWVNPGCIALYRI